MVVRGSALYLNHILLLEIWAAEISTPSVSCRLRRAVTALPPAPPNSWPPIQIALLRCWRPRRGRWLRTHIAELYPDLAQHPDGRRVRLSGRPSVRKPRRSHCATPSVQSRPGADRLEHAARIERALASQDRGEQSPLTERRQPLGHPTERPFPRPHNHSRPSGC